MLVYMVAGETVVRCQQQVQQPTVLLAHKV
jgi:hypothetical protein